LADSLPRQRVILQKPGRLRQLYEQRQVVAIREQAFGSNWPPFQLRRRARQFGFALSFSTINRVRSSPKLLTRPQIGRKIPGTDRAAQFSSEGESPMNTRKLVRLVLSIACLALTIFAVTNHSIAQRPGST